MLSVKMERKVEFVKNVRKIYSQPKLLVDHK